MAITYPENMPDNAGHGDASDVVEPHREPGHRLAVLFGKVVTHHWLEVFHELGVAFRQLWRILVFDLNLFKLLAQVIRGVVEPGAISAPSGTRSRLCHYLGWGYSLDMSRLEVLAYRLTVAHKLHDARPVG